MITPSVVTIGLMHKPNWDFMEVDDMFNPEDMKSCIEEWFADANDIKEVCDTYITVMTEAKEQYLFILSERIKDTKTN